jgi:hypothetical protein
MFAMVFNSPFALYRLDGPLPLLVPRCDKVPPAVLKLRTDDLDAERVASFFCAGASSRVLRCCRRVSDDGVEAGGGRDDKALVFAVEDEVASGEEDLARTRCDGRHSRSFGRELQLNVVGSPALLCVVGASVAR